MRHFPLFLSALLIVAMPALTQAADVAQNSGNPAPAPAAAPAPAPAAVQNAPIPAPAPAAAVVPPAASSFTDAQKTDIEGIIKNYISHDHPEILVEAMQELQKRQAADSEAKNKAVIATDHDKIYSSPDAPVGGNPKGDVTVVEFFDYQCGYCKMAEPTVQKLLKEDKNVKIIYKDFPILGPVSVTAAKAALASVRQDKYQKFHDALLVQKGHLDEDAIYKVARESGIDVERLKKDMNDDAISKIIEANVALGTEIGARGTPTFIVAEQVFPGALEYDQLKKAVDDARAGKKQ